MCSPDVPMQLQYVEFSGLTLRRKLKRVVWLIGLEGNYYYLVLKFED